MRSIFSVVALSLALVGLSARGEDCEIEMEDGSQQRYVMSYEQFMQSFQEELMHVPAPHCPGLHLGDNTVISIIGDCPRGPTTPPECMN